jgi:cytochrome c biogenesis protein CcdA
MPAMVSGIILVAAFAAMAALAVLLAVTAFRRAGSREAGPRDKRLS